MAGAPAVGAEEDAAMTAHPIIRPACPCDLSRPPPGRSSVDDAILLVALMRPFADPRSAEATAGRLLARFGDLGAVMAAEAVELRRVPGVGQPLIETFGVVAEVAVRMARQTASRRPVIASWKALLAYVRVSLANQPREQFRALYLDRRNNLLQDEMVADGTVDHAPVYPREVVRRALVRNASAVILVHNHPSGDPTPSRADIEMTRQIVDAARVFGLQVHDHLVVGREGTASFQSLGLI